LAQIWEARAISFVLELPSIAMASQLDISRDLEAVSFMISDGEDGVVTEHEETPVLRQAPNTRTGMLSARMDRQCSRRELSVPFQSNPAKADAVKTCCERGTVLRKIGLTTLTCMGLCFVALAINMKIGSSVERSRRKYIAGSHPGFVNYIGGKVDASIPDRPTLCDPDIVRMACEVLNNETLEFYGRSANADLDFVHAAEISSVLAVNKDSVHEMFRKLNLQDYDSLNANAYAVSCQELCEALVASFPPMVVPRMSDVGCYWHPLGIKTGIQFAPQCNVDLAPHVLSKIHFPDTVAAKEDNLYGESISEMSPDNHATNIIDETLNQRGSSSQTRAQQVLLQELQYPRVDDEDIRRRVINLFRIHPSINAKVQDNHGLAHMIAPDEPGASKQRTPNIAAIARNITGTLSKDTLAVEEITASLSRNMSAISKMMGRNVSALSKNIGKNISNFVSKESSLSKAVGKNISNFFLKNVSALSKSVGKNISSFFLKNVSALSKSIGKNISNFFMKNVSAFSKSANKTVSKFFLNNVTALSKSLVKNISNWRPFSEASPHRRIRRLFAKRKLVGAAAVGLSQPDDSCKFALDDHCDYDTGSCSHGTDCTDCRDCSLPSMVHGSTDNSCRYNRDGECDETASTAYCAKGTDCTDCGSCGSQVLHREASHLITDWKKITLQNAVRARAVLNQAITALASRQIPDVVALWYGNNLDNPTRNEAMRLMNDVKALLDNVEYVYPGEHCTPDTFAYVFPNSPWNKDDWSGKFVLYLCDYYLKSDASEQIGTLLHEASQHEAASASVKHWQGTAMYGRPLCKQVASFCAQHNDVACDSARKNVDNFCYFVNDAASSPKLGTVEPSGRRRHAIVNTNVPTAAPSKKCKDFWCRLTSAFR